MSSNNKKVVEFPDVEAKLHKPTKQSAFERKKAEAEAKRQREAAETAAVYEDFVKSFEHGGDNSRKPESRPSESRFGGRPHDGRPGGFGADAPFGGGAPRRHFGIPSGPSPKSGPGSLGPPPSTIGKKRSYDGTTTGPQRHHGGGEGGFGSEDRDAGYKSISKAFNASDDEEESTSTTDRAKEKAVSRPTLRLANLPPTTSPAVIKALMPSNLTVENAKIVPPSGPTGAERKSTTAIVTLSKETPATDIDAAVSSLQNRYLGFGFYLSLHRHLSSAAMSSTNLPAITSSTTASHPFGAKRVESRPGRHGPPSSGYSRRFAPPSSYDSSRGASIDKSSILHVPIKPPKDVKQLRMIHKVIESVLKHGPEFEALLMSRPDVQREERWAWIWDARSEGGIWYRWRLWEIVTGLQARRSQGKYLPLFEGSHAWKVPGQPLSYEYTTAVSEFISDSEYNSSDEDDFEDDQNRQGEGAGGSHDQEDKFLNPIEKSKVAHLLARLPTTLSKVRKGDVARVATFAITHASRGADEITEMIVCNIDKPFAYTSANPDYKNASRGNGRDEGDQGSREGSPAAAAAAEEKAAQTGQDISTARLVGLYVISDILSSSSTSGIRHAWRYRQLFETALRNHRTFETLGMMAERHNWGRLRAEKWKRSVGLVLGLWEGWCVFPADTQEFLVNSFEHPPQLKKTEEAEGDAQKRAGRWKTVDAASADRPTESGFLPVSRKPPSPEISPAAPEQVDRLQEILETGDTDGEIGYSYAGDSGEDDDDYELAGLSLDGEPIAEDEGSTSEGLERGGKDGIPSKEHAEPGPSKPKPAGGFQMAASKPAASRKRMRAVDMFADSGSDKSD